MLNPESRSLRIIGGGLGELDRSNIYIELETLCVCVCADIYYLAFSRIGPDKPNIEWALRDSTLLLSLYLLRVRKLLIFTTKKHHRKKKHTHLTFFFNRYVFCFSDISPIISCLLFFSFLSLSLSQSIWSDFFLFFLTLCPYVCVCECGSWFILFLFFTYFKRSKKKIERGSNQILALSSLSSSRARIYPLYSTT